MIARKIRIAVRLLVMLTIDLIGSLPLWYGIFIWKDHNNPAPDNTIWHSGGIGAVWVIIGMAIVGLGTAYGIRAKLIRKPMWLSRMWVIK